MWNDIRLIDRLLMTHYRKKDALYFCNFEIISLYKIPMKLSINSSHSFCWEIIQTKLKLRRHHHWAETCNLVIKLPMNKVSINSSQSLLRNSPDKFRNGWKEGLTNWRTDEAASICILIGKRDNISAFINNSF